MRLLRRLAASFFLALFALLGAIALYAFWPVGPDFDPEPLLRAAARHHVRVIRDEWGVPHVYGHTDADVAYGLAFAHSEDDFATIQKVLLASRGELSSVEGIEAAPMDYLVRLMGVWEDVAQGYESRLAPATRALAEAYADGVNHYAALHPERALPGVIPVTGRDVVAGFAFKTPLFFGFQRVVLGLFEAGRGGDVALQPTDEAFHLVPGGAPRLGSNAIAVGRSRTPDGATRLLVNSHQPYEGPVAWYEAHLHSDEGLDMAGGVFPGSPVILHGHNRDLGWASTVNQPDLTDVYLLDVDPDDPDRYRLDGEWRRLEVRETRIPVRLFGRLRWTVTRELLRSAHGPVLRLPHGTYALRWAGMGEIRQLEQYHRLDRARSFGEWRDAMAMQALPSINFVYADREGNIGYFYNARFPVRVEGVDWQGDLPGDRSDLIWTRSLPFDAVPQVVNPPSGFVANSNHTPFRATVGPGNPDPADFSPTLGIEKRMTNRGLRALELLGDGRPVDAEAFRRIKYDKRYSDRSAARRIVDAVLAAELPDEPGLAAGRRILADWKLTAEVDDRSAALGILTATPIVIAEMRGEPPPDAVDCFREAVRTLLEHHGRLDPPWGEVNRFRRGAYDLPVGGGPDLLRAIEDFELEPDGTYTANSGDSYIMFVEWDRQGRVSSRTIHQYGSATLDPTSPHYDDQVPLFVAEQTKALALDEAALHAHEFAEYRPGEPHRPTGTGAELAR